MNLTKIDLIIFLFIFSAISSQAQDNEIVLKKAIAIPTVNSYVKSFLYIDPIEAGLFEKKWKAPKAGDKVNIIGEEKTWKQIEANEDGWFQDRDLRGGYVYITYHSKAEQKVMLQTMGNKWAYINGEPRIGNRYQGKDKFESWEPNFAFLQLPILLKKGDNHFLFRCNRGRLKVKIQPANSSLHINLFDQTLPDVLIGQKQNMVGAVTLINHSDQALSKAKISVGLTNNTLSTADFPTIPPFGIMKIPFEFEADGTGKKEGEYPFFIRIKDHKGVLIEEVETIIKANSPKKLHRRTYQSSVDGSVQYYAINPASNPRKENAFVLSVHGANVEAWNQASSYEQKTWATIVSPTNRRPYGYNWEDWGRIDAIEVLELAKSQYPHHPDRVYLTGHSMGGHGTWILGSTYPDKFAAIAPSAGYLTVGSYYGRFYKDQGLKAHPILTRAKNLYLTDSLLTNLTNLGVYVLHGGADRVVRPEQAKRALGILETFHKDFQYHEEPGVGHWWDHSDEPGADCVDWLPMFDFFARKARPGKERIRSVKFTTANPSVSSTYYWAEVYDQDVYGEFSKIDLQWDPGKNRVLGTTKNVKVLSLDQDIFRTKDKAYVKIDGDSLEVKWADYQPTKKVYLIKNDDSWKLSQKPNAYQKGPRRYGAFKDVLKNHVVFVYGTGGKKAENNWAIQKARFDAESFWYQGNGSIPVISDQEYLANETGYKERNIVLYGNGNTNLAWQSLLGESPVQVNKSQITMGDTIIEGNGKAALFIRPRKNSETALVGAIGGTDLKGMQLTNTLPYLYQNFALPDVLIYNDEVIGNSAAPVEVIGYFGSDWTIENGEF